MKERTVLHNEYNIIIYCFLFTSGWQQIWLPDCLRTSIGIGLRNQKAANHLSFVIPCQTYHLVFVISSYDYFYNCVCFIALNAVVYQSSQQIEYYCYLFLQNNNSFCYSLPNIPLSFLSYHHMIIFYNCAIS